MVNKSKKKKKRKKEKKRTSLTCYKDVVRFNSELLMKLLATRIKDSLCSKTMTRWYQSLKRTHDTRKIFQGILIGTLSCGESID